jgi:Zn-dependent protease with chaperone function
MKNIRFLILSVLALLVMTGCAATRQVALLPAEDARYARLRAIGDPVLAKMAGETAAEYKNAIVFNQGTNAYIDKDQTITFTYNLFDIFTDEQLQCIYAHEVAHGVLGHYSKRVAASTIVTGAFMALNVVIPGTGYLNHVVNPVTTNYFSREQEKDADALAVRTLGELGMERTVYTGMLAKLKRLSSPSQTSHGGGLWDTHPALDERIAAIESL